MKTPDNIEYFNLLTGFVLSKLYLSFPMPIDLYYKDIMEYIGLPPIFDEKEFFYNTIIWLYTNGYLIHKTTEIQNEYFNYVILTAKGFAVLNSIPEILNPEKSLGDIITDNVKMGANDAIRMNARIALCGMFYSM